MNFKIIMKHTVANISFEQPAYAINQVGGWLEPAVVLSIPSSITIIIQVFNIDGSADGECGRC